MGREWDFIGKKCLCFAWARWMQMWWWWIVEVWCCWDIQTVCGSCSPVSLLPCGDYSKYKYGCVTCCLKSFTGSLPLPIALRIKPKLLSLAEKVLHSLALASFLLSPFPALCGPAMPNYLQLSQASCWSLCLNLPLWKNPHSYLRSPPPGSLLWPFLDWARCPYSVSPSKHSVL